MGYTEVITGFKNDNICFKKRPFTITKGNLIVKQHQKSVQRPVNMSLVTVIHFSANPFLTQWCEKYLYGNMRMP